MTHPPNPPPDRCADCGAQVPANPAFTLNRCGRCALEAGRVWDAQLREERETPARRARP